MSCIKIWGLRTFNKGDGGGDCVFPINIFATGQSVHINSLLTQMRSSHRPPTLSIYFLLEPNTSKIALFRMSFMNRINLIQRFVALAIILFSVMYC